MAKVAAFQITEEHIRDLPHKPYHPSDKISNDARLRAFDKAMNSHLKNYREEMPPLDFRNELFSGNRGKGKTNEAARRALKLFCRGYRVISNASIKFGYHIDTEDVYYIHKVPPNHVLLLDELHIYQTRYAQNSKRQRTGIDGLSNIRKGLVPILGISQQEGNLSHDWLREVDFIYYVLDARTPRRPAFPPWCYKKVYRLGPQPVRGKYVGEQHGIPVFDKPVETKLILPNSWEIYEAAKMQYSFETVKVGATEGLSAAVIRDGMADGSLLSLGDDDLDDEGAAFAAQEAAANAAQDRAEEILDAVCELFFQYETNPSLGLNPKERSFPFEILMMKLTAQGPLSEGEPYHPDEVQTVLTKYCGMKGGRFSVSRFRDLPWGEDVDDYFAKFGK